MVFIAIRTNFLFDSLLNITPDRTAFATRTPTHSSLRIIVAMNEPRLSANTLRPMHAT